MKTEARKQTKILTNDALRTCDAIVTQIESRINWDAYNDAVKRGCKQPWVYL